MHPPGPRTLEGPSSTVAEEDAAHVILVDGDQGFLALAKGFLDQAGGIKVSPASSFDEARAFLRERQFDTVVASYMVSGTSCIDILREMRSSSDDTPFIVLIEQSMVEVAMNAFENGADFYVHRGGGSGRYLVILSNVIRQLVRRNRAKRRNEELLRATVSHLSELESIVNQSRVMVVSWGPGEGMPVDVISSNISQLGYSEDDFTSGRMNFVDIIHPDDRSRILSQVEKDNDGPGSSFRYEYRVLTKSGEVRWIDERTMVTRRSGEPVGWKGLLLDVTEQKHAERSMRNLAMIVGSSHDAIYGIDLDGLLNTWNKATERLYGYTADEVFGEHVKMLVPEENREQESTIWHRVIGGEIVEGYETVRMRKDGSLVDVSITMSPVRNESGTVIGLSAIARDISRRKMAERLLVESELKYRTLFNSAEDAIYIIDLDGQILDVNRTACEQTGYARSELVGGSVKRVDMGQDEWTVRSRIETVARQGAGSFETYHVAKDGRRYPVEVNATKLDFAGRPAVMGIVRDISERKMVEEALRTVMTSLEELESIVTASPAVVFQWTYAEDGSRYVQFVSNNVQQFGYAPSELVSQERRYGDIIHPDDRAAVASDILMYHENGASEFNLVYRIVVKDGTVRWVDDRTTVVKGDGSSPLRHQGIVMDITARKEAEEALKVANDKLNLLGSITRHDVANQLGIVVGAMALLKEDTDDDSREKHLEMMRESISVISQQLEFAGSYQKAGSKPPEWVLVRLDLAAATGSIDMGDVVVESDLGNLEVWADPMFEKVVYNLLENSLRHGGDVKRVRVFADRREDSCVLVFEDDGTGVRPGEKELIFNKGYGRNTGHGLFLSREILGITGITIMETGKSGEGSRFEIHVPKHRFRG